MRSLPIDPLLPRIVATVADAGRLVLQAPPGAGKTTRVPWALADAKVLAGRAVWVLEPRRLAARAAAARVASERKVRLGEEVGYRVRFDASASARTRVCFVTEGVLLRRLIRDPELREIGAVVLDEFHERNVDGDLSLALLREVQQTLRPDLRLVVMSATLDPAPIATYLDTCPVLTSEGREYPVRIEHVPAPSLDSLEARAALAFERVLREGSGGSVLVFMPGAREIQRTLAALEPAARAAGYVVMPLHGDLSLERQDQAIREGTSPRVVIATNLAEASVTVEGVTAVIDSGLARVPRYDVRRGLNRLQVERISQESAAQRTGRAGRVAPGLCLRLYSEREFAAFPERSEPEIRRIDLSAALLQVAAWGAGDPRSFPWLTAPAPGAVDRAIDLLRDLGAVIEEGAWRLTPRGERMSRYPLHPRQARILLEAEETPQVAAAADLAALLGERDLRLSRRAFTEANASPRTTTSSDLFLLADLLEAARSVRFDPASCEALGVDGRAARRIDQTARRLVSLVDAGNRFDGGARPGRPEPASGATASPVPENGTGEEILLRCIATAYPDRVVRRRGPDSRDGVMVGGVGVRLDPSSQVGPAEFVVGLDVAPVQSARGAVVLVRVASRVEPDWIQELFPHRMREEVTTAYDPRRERVLGVRRLLFVDLPLQEGETGTVDPGVARELLYEATRDRAAAVLDPDREARDLLNRLAWLLWRRNDLTEDWTADEPGSFLAQIDLKPPQESGSPSADLGRRRPGGTREIDRAELLDRILRRALHLLCEGRRSVADLRRAPLIEAIQAGLTPRALAALERDAPPRVRLPSGRMARIDYGSGPDPVVAARMQEFFGAERSPLIGSTGVPALLHLLAPNHRPVQVTRDLAGFWSSVYPKIRSELRRRYPKHAWPDDPRAARPESRPGKGPS